MSDNSSQEQPISVDSVFGTPNSPDRSQQNQSSPQNPAPQRDSQGQPSQTVTQALAELDKMEKFKFQGREYTPAELEKAMLRQQDYTKKTQEFAKTREGFEKEQKYHENLAYDLMKIRDNPQLAKEFIQIYPEKFHKHLREVLGTNQGQTQNQQSQQTPAPDVETLQRLERVEKFYHQQEVAKNSATINSQIERCQKKYPDALPELALARIYEAMNDPNVEVTDQLWDETFKASDQQMKDIVKQRYGDLVKKQTEANAKSRDVDTGGGTPGRAPAKFKSLDDVTAHAIKTLRG